MNMTQSQLTDLIFLIGGIGIFSGLTIGFVFYYIGWGVGYREGIKDAVTTLTKKEPEGNKSCHIP